MEKEEIVILVAEEAEYKKCLEYFPEFKCIHMGVGAGNVIKTCVTLPEGTKVINIGYAGSNNIQVGSVALVGDSYRLLDMRYQFEDYNNPLRLSAEGLPCYTNNCFITETDKTESVLFDMELNYIASFVPHIELLGSIKVISDNLDMDAFLNNAIRESGVLTSDKVWTTVRKMFEENFGKGKKSTEMELGDEDLKKVNGGLLPQKNLF